MRGRDSETILGSIQVVIDLDTKEFREKLLTLHPSKGYERVRTMEFLVRQYDEFLTV